MTPVEIKAALAAIAAEAGPKAWIDTCINPERNDARLVSASMYPAGIVERHVVIGYGADFAEAIADLQEKWAEHRTKADGALVRKMALAIIEVTGDHGECSDAALRGAGFYQSQIDRIGSLACAEATRLAAGGPFSIVSTIGANAEAA